MNTIYGGISGKTAVITGGASGIGAGAARLFAQQGAAVVIDGGYWAGYPGL